MKRVAIIISIALSGCGTPVMEGANCPFWKTVPYDRSQDPWRQFDCPFEHQRDIRLGYGN